MNQDKNNDELWNAISRIEVSVKNTQNDTKKLFLHSARQEIAIESLRQENRERFDQIEQEQTETRKDIA